ncbi:MAG: short chain dehydrogenase [Gammaproteobacteria bacterium]|nr:MAG: short chain dehydrogenase [Gammaproteobacteria bacterium]
MSQSNNRVLITGGASGLGKELALRFAAEGYRICIADLNQSRAEETLAIINNTPGEAFFIKCDVSSPDDWAATVNAMKDQWGGVDILINNAGVASGGPFNWLSADDWKWIMDINFYGVLYGCQAVVPFMINNKSGHIINIASMAGIVNPPGMSNYNVSKAAVISLSESLHVELKPHKIKVTCVTPSFFKTNLGESMRTPDQATALSLEKIMENSSELTASDIAEQIYQAVMHGEYLVMPHEEAKQAYQLKNHDLNAHFKHLQPLAEHVLARAKRKET